MNKRKVHIMLVSLASVCGVTLAVVLFLLLSSPLRGEKSFDFGIVPIERPQSILKHTFHLTNTTNHTLQLTDVIPTCGCTTTDWPTEPVLAGEELRIPVHLKLQKSRYRSSNVRLEFETGEVVTLHIAGTGRFTQPLRCLPPSISVVKESEEGTSGVLNLEWFEESTPPQPTFTTPEHVRIDCDNWKLSKKGDPHRGTPDNWTIQMHVYLDADVGLGSEVGIEMTESPTLLVPLVQVESIERPPFFTGSPQ
jgi:hypothetical protein